MAATDTQAPNRPTARHAEQSRWTRLFRLGLFGRTFLLLSTLMIVSLLAWLQVFFSMEIGPRAYQMAQRVVTSVNITRAALIYSAPDSRSRLLLDLATNEGLQVYPRTEQDDIQALPHDDYWTRVATLIRSRQGEDIRLASSVNNISGIWVSFRIDDEDYWLVFERDQFGLTGGMEWIGWGVTALILSLIGAAISVGFVNRPLSRLAKAVQELSRGSTPLPLPEGGPEELRRINASFNRMAHELRQSEEDRELMLAGLSHDLRTPLARLRLEIEMSGVSEDTLQNIDQDLGQIERCIGQLMDYARPAGTSGQEVTFVSDVLHEIYQRERSHTEALGGTLQADIAPDLYARISDFDLKRIITNLIENARRYGLSGDGRAHINLSASVQGKWLRIDVSDQGPGIPLSDSAKMLRPFSRGESARTGVSGAGLGLSIVERLLSQIGGRLNLLQNDPSGLLVRIELPRPQQS